MDREDMRRALLDVRVAADDIDGIVTDMLAPLGRRELGRVLHRRNYGEARGKLTAAIGYLFKLAGSDGGEPTDPAGSGGAGPIH